MKLLFIAFSLVSALLAAEASPSFSGLEESSKGHGHHHHRSHSRHFHPHQHPHHSHHHHRSSSSSSSSSHHHHHHSHHHHDCPEELLISTAVANTRNVETYIVNDNPAPILDMAFPTASVLVVSPSCLTPLNGCCNKPMSLATWLADLLVPTVQWVNQIPENLVKVLPCGSIVVTAVQILTTGDPADWKVAQVEFTWKRTYGCNLKLAAVKAVDSSCIGQYVTTACSTCAP